MIWSSTSAGSGLPPVTCSTSWPISVRVSRARRSALICGRAPQGGWKLGPAAGERQQRCKHTGHAGLAETILGKALVQLGEARRCFVTVFESQEVLHEVDDRVQRGALMVRRAAG